MDDTGREIANVDPRPTPALDAVIVP
jgi:hypothetical protein